MKGRLFVLPLLIVLVLVLGAFQGTTVTPGAATPGVDMEVTPAVATPEMGVAPTTGDTTGMVATAGTTMRAGTILGSDVMNPNGDLLGGVADLLLEVRTGTMPVPAGTGILTDTLATPDTGMQTTPEMETAPDSGMETTTSTPSGRVLYALVSFGGFLGLGETTVAVPFGALDWNVDQDTFFLNATREDLESAPTFAPENLPTDAGDPNWDMDIRTYWQGLGLGMSEMDTGTGMDTDMDMAATPEMDMAATPEAEMAATPEADMAATPEVDMAATPEADTGTLGAGTTGTTTGRGMIVVRASRAVGFDVVDPMGKNLGGVVDLLIEVGGITPGMMDTGLEMAPTPEAGMDMVATPEAGMETDADMAATPDAGAGTGMATATGGRVRYAVVGYGGFLGLGETRVAVPWQAFAFDPDARVLILNADRDRLENAPGFDPEDLPEDILDPTWDLELREYWQDLTGADSAQAGS